MSCGGANGYVGFGTKTESFINSLAHLHVEGLVGLEEQQDGGHEEEVHGDQGVGRHAGEEVDNDGSDDGDELKPDAPPETISVFDAGR